MLRFYKVFGAIALAVSLLAMPSASFAQVSFGIGLSVNFGPPALPVYVQPVAPAPDLIWTPGYWAYGPYGYYWVPGTWVAAPQPGYLWTPGYWGYAGGGYGWHAGYWGTSIGFYGGINYGGGYFGSGFYGGHWGGPHFIYNTAYSNVNTNIVKNTYVNKTVTINNTTINNYNAPAAGTTTTAFNGGPHGIQAHPSSKELAYASQHHIPPTPLQTQHEKLAGTNKNYLASVNHGHVAEPAVAKPLDPSNTPKTFEKIPPTQPKVSDYHPEVTGGTLGHGSEHKMTEYHTPSKTLGAPHTSTYHAPPTTYHAPAAAHTYKAPTTVHPMYHAPVHTVVKPPPPKPPAQKQSPPEKEKH